MVVGLKVRGGGNRKKNKVSFPMIKSSMLLIKEILIHSLGNNS